MIVVAMSGMVLLIILGCVFVYSKTYFFILIAILLVGAIATYIPNFRAVNAAAWLIVDGRGYTQVIADDSILTQRNAVPVTLTRNVDYRFEFEFTTALTTTAEVAAFERVTAALRRAELRIRRDTSEQPSVPLASVALYDRSESSWTAGTIIRADSTRTSAVTGFSSAEFSVPFSLSAQHVSCDFELPDEVVAYFREHSVTMSVVHNGDL